MDAAKVMAAAFYYDGDPWDMIGHGQENWVIPMRALPVITVPTLAAAGSEMNHGAVISNDESKVKSFVQADCLFPKVALEGVDKFEEFLRSIGCPTRLSEVGIGDELLSQYAEDAAGIRRTAKKHRNCMLVTLSISRPESNIGMGQQKTAGLFIFLLKFQEKTNRTNGLNR